MRDAVIALLACSTLSLAQDIGKLQVFPPDNPWNWDISRHAVHPDSARFIASIGADKPLHPDFGREVGIPYCVVPGTQKKVPIKFSHDEENDKGPYPIPDDAPIEGGADSEGDRHVLVIDRDNHLLYELDEARKAEQGWTASWGSVFKLDTNDLRPEGWTSADAAGLPIFPGLVRYEEVERGEIRHALRFTVRKTQKKHWWPARHDASSDTSKDLPPMGLRVRLKAGYDLSKFPKRVQVILKAIQTYGLILADNGSDWYLTGAPDKRWNDDEMHALARVKGSDLEVVQTVDEHGKPIPPRGR